MKRCIQCATAFNANAWTCPSCGFAPREIDGHLAFAPELARCGGGFRPEIYRELAAAEKANFWFRTRNRLIIWALQRHFPAMNRFLEVGCGTGFVLQGVAGVFTKAKITGSEIFSVGLSFAQRRVPGVELIQMDARRIPYSDEFDVVGAFDVLEHIEEDEQVLTELYTAVKPGGGILIGVPQHPWLWSRQDEYARHVRRYRIGELRCKVRTAGFRVVYETSFVTLLLPAMLIARRFHRGAVGEYDPMAELRLPPLLNALFARIMDLERQLIRHGLRMPFGGSGILVGIKPQDEA